MSDRNERNLKPNVPTVHTVNTFRVLAGVPRIYSVLSEGGVTNEAGLFLRESSRANLAGLFGIENVRAEQQKEHQHKEK